MKGALLRIVWIGLALATVVLYRSQWWDRHRWIGFALGAILAWVILTPLRKLRTYRDKYLARRDCLRLGILSTAIGLYMTSRFMLGGGGAEGLFGVVATATGIQYLYFVRVWSNATSSDEQVVAPSASGNRSSHQ